MARCSANGKICKAGREGKKEGEGSQGEQGGRATNGTEERDRGAWAGSEGDQRGLPVIPGARATNETKTEGDKQERQARPGFEGGQRERGRSPRASSMEMDRRRAEEARGEGEEGQPAVRVGKVGLDWREEGLDSRILGTLVYKRSRGGEQTKWSDKRRREIHQLFLVRQSRMDTVF